jgi:hypothetical protein
MEASIAGNTGPVLHSFIPHATGFARVPESLLLIFAVSVIEQALLVLRESGTFSSQSTKLGALMSASRGGIPWQAYTTIDAIRKRRNEVAHEAVLLQAGECSAALASIAQELLAWHALETDYVGQFSFSMTPTRSDARTR